MRVLIGVVKWREEFFYLFLEVRRSYVGFFEIIEFIRFVNYGFM